MFVCLNDTATTEIYTYGHTRSRHVALPLWSHAPSTAVRILLKSCATPPASWPTACIFDCCATWRFSRDSSLESLRLSSTAASPSPRTPTTRIDTGRSEEHTSELQSLMRISYAVFCLKKQTTKTTTTT